MISVIIPTLNEAAHLPALIRRLRAIPEVSQIIISDGGSMDETVSLALSLGVQVVRGATGRGPQLNSGAAEVGGEVLWFLHADAWPGLKAGRQINRAICRGAVGGNFRVRFADRGVAARLFECIARQQRRLGIYYGDSGIWVRRDCFELLNGYKAWPLFEDYDFVRRLEKLAQEQGGHTFVCPGPLLASARRFQKHPWKILVQWLWLQARFSLGADPEQLGASYHRRRK